MVFGTTVATSAPIVGVVAYTGKNGKTYHSPATRVWVGRNGITWYGADRVKHNVKFKDHLSAHFLDSRAV